MPNLYICLTKSDFIIIQIYSFFFLQIIKITFNLLQIFRTYVSIKIGEPIIWVNPKLHRKTQQQGEIRSQFYPFTT